MDVTLKMENINSWSDVNWSEINKRIYRLQLRIYRASQNYDRDKIHKLQKLLTAGDSAKLLAVRKVIQEDEEKKILGIDDVTHLSSSKRLELARSIHLDDRLSRLEIFHFQGKRSSLEDRSKEALATLALQPQWDSKADPHTVVIRLGSLGNDSNTGLWKSVGTLRTSFKESVYYHKVNLRDIIKKHKGVSQKNLIYKLNPIIRDWALSKRTQLSSKVFSEMDKFIYLHLWNWARKRHPKMSHTKIKDKYWHIVGNSNWTFGTNSKGTEREGTKVFFILQRHSDIKLKHIYKL